MFDIGFWELIVVGVVALVVLGPERLPVVARKVGHWIGRIRRFVNEAKSDIDREIRLQEIKKAIERDAGLDEIKNIIDAGKHTIEDEVQKVEYVVKAQPDQPQDDNAQYAHTEHKINPLDLLEEPASQTSTLPPPPVMPTIVSPPPVEPIPVTLPASKHGNPTNG